MRRVQLSRLAPAVFAAALLLVPALALPASAATDALDQSQMTVSAQLPDGVFGNPAAGGAMEAQTFTAGVTGQLDRVEVYVSSNTGTDALDVAIEGTATISNFAGTFTAPDGTALASATVTPASTAGWVDVPLPTAVGITAGTQYAIVLSTSSAAFFNVYGVSGTTAYAGGQAIHYGGGQWYPQGAELAFQTYVVVPQTCLSGAVGGGLTVTAGQTVCLGATATVTGPVRVEAGGTLDVEGATIHGPVRAERPAGLRICGARITGPLVVTGSTGAVVVGDGGACAGSTITGPVLLFHNTGSVSLEDASITGPVGVVGNLGGVTVVGNMVRGPLRVAGNAAPSVVSGNRASGPRSRRDGDHQEN